MGFGVTDVDYPISRMADGKQVTCNYYSIWKEMIRRCIGGRSAYKECSVCDEWKSLSNFKLWAEGKYKNGLYLDKDILIKGNKTYSPNACCFVDRMTNNFTVNDQKSRGPYKLGATEFKRDGNFKSQCCNPFTGLTEHLGYFDDPDDAHIAWRKRKHELACMLAEMQNDDRVAAALRVRYL